MRRPLPIAATLALALGLCACQTAGSSGTGGPGGGPAGGDAILPGILERGELRVGLSGQQPPLNMRNKRGELVGLDVDLARALARSMGLRVRFVERPFGELLATLEAGDVDLVISGMTITAERNARVAFAGPYFISGKSALTRSETVASVEEPEELDDPSRRFAVLAGSTSERFVEDVLPRARRVPVPDYDTAIAMVLDGKVDALFADFPICALAMVRHPEANLSMLTAPLTAEPLGIALPPGDPLFVNLVQNYLNLLDDTGLLTQLKARWFTRGDWVSELP